MLKLNNIGPTPGSVKNRKRRGRGPGTGQGKTGGRGHKGQKARAGGGIPPWFEGGQMPISRRLPKRGFTNIFKKQFQIVNLDALTGFEAGTKIDASALVEAGLIKHADQPIKLLGRGKLEKALQIEVSRASKAAVVAVEAAGGTVTLKG
jgi:large subunit ribosomal protein L15